MTAALDAWLRRHRWLADVAGIGVVVFVALLYLSPVLRNGFSFSPSDLGASASYLTRGTVTAPIHNHLIGDVVDQDVPWNTLDWRTVHAGSLPLWDSDAGTGLPQLFNFESAPLALPSLVGYLFPLSASFLVTVLGKLLIAGIGTYVLCRVLRTGAVGATLGGVSFMLSGSFAGWLGWAIGGPVAWSGFIVAGAVLAYRSRRVRYLWLLALSVAFAVYGGFPEDYVLMGALLAAVLAIGALGVLVTQRRLAPWGIARVAAGMVCGFALSAPLWLPGISILAHSARLGKQVDQQFGLHAIVEVFTQGFYGTPVLGSTWFGPANYVESTAYVGVVALVLAGVAVLVAWRRPVVIALVAGTLGCLVVAYHFGGPWVPDLVNDLGLSSLPIHRVLILLAFPVAVLAGIGCDAVVKRFHERPVQWALAVATAAVAVVVGSLWSSVDDPGLTAFESSIRRSSLVWPTATIAGLAVIAAGVFVAGRLAAPMRRRIGAAVGAALVAGQAAFLVVAGAGFYSYTKDLFPTTSLVKTVQRVVGTSLVASDGPNLSCADTPPSRVGKACGIRLWLGIGFIPNMQLDYQIDELGMHDPTIPASYFTHWPVPDSGQSFQGNLQFFAPSIDTVALARRYGVSYVLVGPGRPVPAGMRAVTRLPINNGAYLVLAKVPDSARFSFLAPPSAARVLASRHPGDASYSLRVRVDKPSELVLRITYFPGWHVTADGRPLAVHRYEGSFLEVTVPAGTHTVVAHYWPRDLSYGIVLTFLALLALALAPFSAAFRGFGFAAVGSARRRFAGSRAAGHRGGTPRGN
jgi:hypothetical protein